jgi:hypothetical protein
MGVSAVKFKIISFILFIFSYLKIKTALNSPCVRSQEGVLTGVKNQNEPTGIKMLKTL